MPDFSDTPTSEGATNVALHQRAATAPFAREVVNIQGDENPGRAIGFNAEGVLTTLLVGGDGGITGPVELVDMAPLPRGVVIGRKSVDVGVPEAVTVADMIALDVPGTKLALGKIALADMANLAQGRLIARVTTGAGTPEAVTLPQVIGLDPEAVRVALHVSEDPFVTVDTQAQFDAALTAGRSMVLRGEGTGGVITLTTPKNITARWTTIKSDTGAVLSFAISPLPAVHLRRGITVRADDVTLRDFEMLHTGDLTANTLYGIAFSEGVENLGHRTKLLGLTLHNWLRCISKDGSLTTTSHDDVLIERCFLHTFKEMGACLNFGFTRLVMRDCRVLGRLTWSGTDPGTHNAVYGGTNWRDCLIHNCFFGNVSRHGFEATPANELQYVHQRTRVVMCRAENCLDMAFSLGFCAGGIFDHCSVKNCVHAGFEIGGRVAGHPAAGANPSFFAQGIIDSCEVDGITHTGLPAYGFTLDGAGDTIVRGACRIRNVTSTIADGACGIGLTDCERVTIQGALIEDCGHKFIYADAVYLPITPASGFHQFSGNVFRNRAGYPPTQNHYAIWIRNQCASIRQNTAWQKPTTFLGYQSTQDVGSANVVMVDGTPVGGGAVLLGGSNEICNG
jgi:hypothetical protein